MTPSQNSMCSQSDLLSRTSFLCNCTAPARSFAPPRLPPPHTSLHQNRTRHSRARATPNHMPHAAPGSQQQHRCPPVALDNNAAGMLQQRRAHLGHASPLKSSTGCRFFIFFVHGALAWRLLPHFRTRHQLEDFCRHSNAYAQATRGPEGPSIFAKAEKF